jgi:arginine utilization protein RocB
MEIEDIKNEDLQKKIADYKEWTEKALDCRDAVQELRNTQIELFADWAHIPTEYAEKKIDKLTARYDELENKMKTASGSGSKVAAYAELQADRRTTELDKVQKNIDSYNATAQ